MRNTEMLYFAYERFGDFFITEQLLDKYTAADEVKQAFQKDNELGKLIEGYLWPNRGILEAMAIRLPEKYGLEIVEVFDWVFELTSEPQYRDVDERLTNFLWDSLKWRLPSSIDNKKITKWLRSEFCTLQNDSYLFRLIELTTVYQHPFNGDRLFRFLNQFSMPDRDAFWLAHVRGFSGIDDEGIAFPIRRLIDWAWQKGVSTLVETETARLAGQTLAWLLSSTYRKLRDQTTKAMVNLLEEQPDALINIMKAFKDIDDDYIAERLYAVAYGCGLRTSTDASLRKIAQYVYTSTFKHGNPRPNALLRDYARNVIEYAHYKGLVPKTDMTLVRPPYQSKYPDTVPTKADVEQYDSKYDDTVSDEEKRRKRIHGRIHHSTIDWDFGRYTVEGELRGFSPISFTMEAELKAFKRELKRGQKELLKGVASTIETHAFLQARKDKGQTSLGDKSLDELLTDTQEFFEHFSESLKGDVSPEKLDVARAKVYSFSSREGCSR